MVSPNTEAPAFITKISLETLQVKLSKAFTVTLTSVLEVKQRSTFPIDPQFPVRQREELTQLRQD